MILMGANQLLGPLEEVALKIASLVAIAGPKQKGLIFRAHPFQYPCNGFACIKIITSHPIYKQHVH